MSIYSEYHNIDSEEHAPDLIWSLEHAFDWLSPRPPFAGEFLEKSLPQWDLHNCI